MKFNTELEELEVNPFKSEFVEGLLGTYYWNFKTTECIGPMNEKELENFTSKCGELIDFDLAIQRRRGVNAAQVFKNHSYLRIMGFLKNGRYVHEGRGPKEAA